MPILFISARSSDEDVLTALSIGGDDYIKKPYSLSILPAKVKAILGRYEKAAEAAQAAASKTGSAAQSDRSRLSQVVANIISNSYKYAGTPIDVRFAFAGDFLTVTFADQGGGVPEEELEQITQKYYRGRENAAGKEGSGLGLYISRILMEKMQGELSCSCPEGGFAVTLSLPLS